ncbi:MAG TPA: universal stress protein [Pseudolysinimonas sp.]
MERILVGIDDEAASQTAVDWVIERAQHTPLHVTLVTAFDLLTSDPSADEDLLGITAKRIETAAPGTEVDTELIQRSILEGLIERSTNADLLVIGSHPHRKVRSILTGALPSALVAGSHCATVVVPDDWSRGGHRIVLGVADDESSDTATRFAAREARSAGTPLDAIHTWRLPQPSMDAVSSLIVDPEELEAMHEELLQRVTDRLGDAAPGVVVRGVLRAGDAAIEIDELLDDTRLLVLGTHGRDPALGALLGSKVQHLLHHGRVPVAVVPLEARVS